jgi:hypothetical protein
MPCYFSYRLYTETVNSDDVEYLMDAAINLGYQVTTTNRGYKLGSIDAVRKGSDYELSSKTVNTLNDLIQECSVLRMMSKATLSGLNVEREDIDTGSKHQVRLRVTS